MNTNLFKKAFLVIMFLSSVVVASNSDSEGGDIETAGSKGRKRSIESISSENNNNNDLEETDPQQTSNYIIDLIKREIESKEEHYQNSVLTGVNQFIESKRPRLLQSSSVKEEEDKIAQINPQGFLLSKIEEDYTARGSLDCKDVFSLRKKLPFIADSKGLKDFHSALSDQLRQEFLLYKKVDTSARTRHITFPLFISSLNIICAGVNTIVTKLNDYTIVAGVVQVLSGSVGLGSVYFNSPSKSNNIHHRNHINTLPFCYDDEEIDKQSRMIALLLMSRDFRKLLNNEGSQVLLNQYIREIVENIMNNYLDQLNSLSYTFAQLIKKPENISRYRI